MYIYLHTTDVEYPVGYGLSRPTDLLQCTKGLKLGQNLIGNTTTFRKPIERMRVRCEHSNGS